MSSGDLRNIDIASGVNERHKPFLTISVNGGDLMGQLSPKEVRAMALQWLAAAEAAESDSLILRTLEAHDVPREIALHVLVEMRKLRG